MAVVQLALVKQFLDISSDTHDDELQDMTDRAEAILEAQVGPLTTTTVTDEVHTGPGPLLLHEYPVVAVTSATSDGASVSDLDLDTRTGLLYGTFSRIARSARVTYTAGRATLPLDLEQAVLEMVKHLWESQRGNSPAAMALQDPDQQNLQGQSTYLLPYRVQTLIEPYVRQRDVA